MRQFNGLPGISNILLERQRRAVEENVYSRMEDLVEKCRRHVLEAYRKGRELKGHELEGELVRYLLEVYPDLGVNDRAQVARVVVEELEGYGPLQRLMDNPTVTDIIVINPERILYEQDGELKIADARFRSVSHLQLLIERFCYLSKRRVDESNPSVTLTLPEGYRVAVSIPPLSGGAHLSIRKFVYVGNIDGLVPGMYSPGAAQFLKAAARGRLNVIFAGPMGVGKTTMLAVLAHEFGPLELPVLVEEVRECPMVHPNLRNYVARPANIDGKGEIKFDYILKHALQTRATRIMVAEVRDGAIFYMLRAFASGQSGMSTLHAETPEDAVQVQMPMMVSQAPEARNMDVRAINMIIGAAVDLVVQLNREYDEAEGRDVRVCTHISEVQRSRGEDVQVKHIFVREGGELVPTGYVPVRVLAKMARNRVAVPESLFSTRKTGERSGFGWQT